MDPVSMGERTNGNITIVAGLPEANGVKVDGHASASRRREIAERLRKQGWSYRRIADALSVSYATIQVWLDDPPIRASVEPLPIAVNHPRLSVVGGTEPRISATTSPIPAPNHAELMERIGQLAEEQRRQAEAMQAMEKRLLRTLREEIKVLGQKLMETIKTLKPKSKTAPKDPV
jgi:hypothetical protein